MISWCAKRLVFDRWRTVTLEEKDEVNKDFDLVDDSFNEDVDEIDGSYNEDFDKVND